jgi:hypothetical protein
LKKTGKFRSTEETVLVGYKKFSGDCLYCSKKGHKAAECFKLKNRNEVDERGAVVFMAETLDHEEPRHV